MKKTWIYEKFSGDLAIYAFCPECGFHYMCGERSMETGEPIITNIYNYCPMCGENLQDSSAEMEVIWNERSVEELWGTQPENSVRKV